MSKKEPKHEHFPHSNFIEMLKTFSKDEVEEFDKFVRSPFHNNRNEVTRFYGELKKYHPLFNQKDFTKEKIFGKLHPDEEFRDDVMSRLGTNLKSLIENYLSCKELSEDTFERKLMLMDSLNKRKLDKILDKEIRSTEEALESNEGISTDYFLKKHRLSIIIQNFTLSRGNMKAAINNYRVSTDNLIYFFLTELFVNLFSRKVTEVDFNVTYDYGINTAFMNFFNAAQMFDEIKNNSSDSNILVLACYYSYRVYQNYEDEGLQLKLKDLLKKYSDKFFCGVSYNLYTVLLSVYAVNESNGNFSDSRKRFEVYKDMISKNLLIPTGLVYLREVDLINIIDIANSLKEFDWAESLVEEYIDKIHPDERNDIYNYCKADIAYNRKEFDTALNLIMKVKLANFNSKVKRLLSKIYYDMDYTEQLLSFIDSFRHYLNNDKSLPKDLTANHLSFLLYLSNLEKIKSNNDYEALHILKNKILEDKATAGKKWLLEKVDELEQKVKKQRQKSKSF
jgi:hypothetical protein